MKKDNNSPMKNQDNKINRKEAIQKVGKYAAFTAASMMLLMSPATNAAAQNSPKRPRRH